MEFEKIVINLIESKREGPYWDFKKEPYSNNSDLLHDIICMANSVTKCNKYIIMGVNDPKLGAEVVGVDISSPNRKTQSQYIDFLRGISFSSNKRPEIELRTISFDSKIIDILIIVDQPLKPYYLTEDKDGIKANYIYTRIGDTNTPKNRSCDEIFIEKMYQERFGIDVQPSERIKNLLNLNDLWDIDPGNRKVAYCKTNPEYTIQFSKTREGWEVYSHYFPNKRSFFGTAKFKYFSTVLFECSYVFVDEFRIPLATPDIENIKLGGQDYFYYYYEKDDIKYKLTRLMGLNSLRRFRPRYLPFLFFENKGNRNDFNQFLLTNSQAILEEEPDPIDVHRAERIMEDGDGSGVDPIVMGKIIRWYNKWKDGGQT